MDSADATLGLDPQLLEILRCPACRAELRVEATASELVCTSSACGLAYPVRDGIPVLLVDEARRPAG
jgi:uncharacterized protein YbaR (Trm112 family)